MSAADTKSVGAVGAVVSLLGSVVAVAVSLAGETLPPWSRALTWKVNVVSGGSPITVLDVPGAHVIIWPDEVKTA